MLLQWLLVWLKVVVKLELRASQYLDLCSKVKSALHVSMFVLVFKSFLQTHYILLEILGFSTENKKQKQQLE